MCTLSFIPKNNSYLVAMNRDERIARPQASPPAIFNTGGIEAIYPRDVEGGTWIAVNSYGVACALLNRSDRKQTGKKISSRGHVIPALMASDSSENMRRAVAQLDLRGVLPFRLLGIFPTEEEIAEWSWDTVTIKAHTLSWEQRHWFSSSLSDGEASKERGAVCDRARRQEGAGSPPWLRRLHASHASGWQNPFNICVHREEVGTISYTEMVCTQETIRCNYLPGPACNEQRVEYSVETRRVGQDRNTHPQSCPARQPAKSSGW
jgi:hypothetical protein